jgi:hypothetical protein
MRYLCVTLSFSVFLVLTACQTHTTGAQKRTNSWDIKSGKESAKIYNVMQGTWYDGSYDGTIVLHIDSVSGSTFSGTMAFEGVSSRCADHSDAKGKLLPDGTLEIANNCNGGTTLILKESKGIWDGSANWGGTVGSIAGLR